MSEYEPPKLGFVPPPPVLWAWRCPNDGTLHWLHVGRECHCGFLLAAADPLAERDEARAQRDALAEALRKLETVASYLMENYLKDETEDRNLAHSDDHWAALSLVVAALGDARAALEKTRGA